MDMNLKALTARTAHRRRTDNERFRFDVAILIIPTSHVLSRLRDPAPGTRLQPFKASPKLRDEVQEQCVGEPAEDY